jgi:hypothetical protein
LSLSRFSTRERNKDTLKRKFQSLYLKKQPTGNPHIPPHVLLAKYIYNEIKLKSDLSEGEDDDDDVEDDEDDDIEDDPPLPVLIGNRGTVTTGSTGVTLATNSNNQQLVTPRVSKNKNQTKKIITSAPPAVPSFGTPVIRAGTRTHPADPFDKYIKLMMMQKEADREDRKERERIKQEEAIERREELRLQREEARQQIQANQQFMQMGLLSMVSSNNNNGNIPAAVTSNIKPPIDYSSNVVSIPTAATGKTVSKQISSRRKPTSLNSEHTRLISLVDTEDEAKTTLTNDSDGDDGFGPVAKRNRR